MNGKQHRTKMGFAFTFSQFLEILKSGLAARIVWLNAG
jgi:hypothetical protein